MCDKVERILCIQTVKYEATGNAITESEGENTLFLMFIF